MLTANSGLVTSIAIGITDSKVGFYTYLNPTFDLSYCSFVSNALTDRFIDATASATAVVLQSGSDTVMDMDSSITTQVTVTFKVETTFTGGFTWKSPLITVSVLDCSAITISPSITTPITKMIRVGSTAELSKQTFTSFACSIPICCVGINVLVYKVSPTSTLTTFGIAGVDDVGDQDPSIDKWVKPTDSSLP